jgi:hypothetical protein
MLKTQMPFIKTQLLITTDLKMPLKPGVTKQQRQTTNGKC